MKDGMENLGERRNRKTTENNGGRKRRGRLHMCVCLTPCSDFVWGWVKDWRTCLLLCAPLTCNSDRAWIKSKFNHNYVFCNEMECLCACDVKVQWRTRTSRRGWVALEGSEAAGEGRLELGGEEDPQLCDDASCDELVRGYVERWVPHLDTCGKQWVPWLRE